MKLTLTQIANAMEALTTLSQEETTKIPFPLAYAIAKNKNSLELPMQLFEARRMDFIHTYGAKDEDGKLIQGENGEITIQDKPHFLEELEKILSEEVDIEIQPIKYNDLKEMGITIAFMQPILFLVEEG